MSDIWQEPTQVQIIRRKKDLTLVQWIEGDTPKRAWVTPTMLVEENGDTGSVLNPGEGIPYGVAWEHIFETGEITPELVDRELKRAGIWTIEDLQAAPTVARKVMMGLYGLDIVKMLNTAASKQQSIGGSA